MATTPNAQFAVGDTVLYGSRKGVVRYIGEVPKLKGTHYGVELDDPVGISDGSWKGQRLFETQPNHAIFVRASSLRAFSVEEQAAIRLQKSYRGFLVRRSGLSLKRSDGKASSKCKSRFGNLSDVAAALMIQRALRGKAGREVAKKYCLWKAWNLLDTKDESELVHTFDQYEELKKTYAARAGAQAGEQAPASTKPHSRASSAAGIHHAKSLPQIHGQEPTMMEGNTPRLPEVITLDFVTAVMDHFKHDNLLALEDVVRILSTVRPILAEEPNVVRVQFKTQMTIVGDIHGQLDDLFTIFKLNGLPSLRHCYLFNGDFVDRGQNSVECILVLLCFKLLYPNNVFLNRGNHEARDINSRDGFEKECIQKYGIEVFDLFSDVFSCLPLAHVINDAIFVVHGGLAWEDFTIEQLQAVDRFHEVPPIDSLVEQILWSDPQKKPGKAENPRGASVVYGPDVVEKFLEENGLRLLVRSHECMEEGYQIAHSGHTITVFSASNYCGVVGNDGAFINVKRDMRPRIVQFSAQPKEKISRYRMRHALIENDVISKLLRRIAENRLALVDYYLKMDKDKSGTITRMQWAEGLKTILAIDIPFLEFQGYLGLPKLGVTGEREGSVDYMQFLDRYRIHLKFDEPEGEVSTSVKDAIDQLANLLFRKRYELESLFRYFDANGDGVISMAEFREGVLSLRKLLNHSITDAQVDEVIAYLDTNADGVIQYDEFFSGFQVQDPELAKVAQKAEEQQNSRRGPKKPASTGPAGPNRVSVR